MAWNVDPRSNELMLAVRRRGDGLCRVGLWGARYRCVSTCSLQRSYKATLNDVLAAYFALFSCRCDFPRVPSC